VERIVPQLNDLSLSRPSLKVHIEELVLHGFAARDRHRIATAVQGELARLMAEGSLLRFRQSPPTVDRINGGAFKVKAGAKPQAAGAGIARAVFQSLRRHAAANRRGAGFQPAQAPPSGRR
jgi:hypothetical protein